jgi:hypothetical protein
LKETATTNAASAPPPIECRQLISPVLCFAFDALALSNVTAADADETTPSRMSRRSEPRSPRPNGRKTLDDAGVLTEEVAVFIENLSANFGGKDELRLFLNRNDEHVPPNSAGLHGFLPGLPKGAFLIQ